jgi:hypothetical protein
MACSTSRRCPSAFVKDPHSVVKAGQTRRRQTEPRARFSADGRRHGGYVFKVEELKSQILSVHGVLMRTNSGK